MAVTANALAIVRGDWSGTAQLKNGATTATVTPTGNLSAFGVWLSLIQAARAHWSMTWSVTEDGFLVYTSTTSLELLFTGGMHTRLGFGSSSYSTALTRTGTGLGIGVLPGPVTWRDHDRLPDGEGATGHGRASWLRIPVRQLRAPVLSGILTAGQSVLLADACEAMTTGVVEVYSDTETRTSIYLDQVDTRAEGRAGHHTYTIRGVAG